MQADHPWGNYHWDGTATPVQLTLGDNFRTSAWDTAYDDAVADWNVSSVLELTLVAGGTSPRRCRPKGGKIEVCADTYGVNGWLGLASISVSGDHITKAYAKMNDSYFVAGGPYDSAAWRALVMCQEIGHDFGLGHQDEDFDNNNLDTCMDYTSDPQSNQHPNDHDYYELEDIYAHLNVPPESVDPGGDDGGDGGGGGNCPPNSNKPSCRGSRTPPPAFDMVLSGIDQWGELLETSADGGQSVFMQDFGNGHRVYTHVTWTLEVAEGLRNSR